MNVARVMGNTMDTGYVDDLSQAFHTNADGRVQGMVAWALGKIGGPKSQQALEDFARDANEPVLGEISSALERLSEQSHR